MQIITVKYLYEDRGNFRHYYKGTENNKLYCTAPLSMLTLSQWKASGEPREWLECSKDGEPSHVIIADFIVIPKKRTVSP
jgi:hypothetical protein